MTVAAYEALRDLVALVEDAHLDASVSDEQFAVIVRARAVLREHLAEGLGLSSQLDRPS